MAVGILIVSILSGIVLGEGKLEKVLLAVQGFFPALMVLMIISTGLHVTC